MDEQKGPIQDDEGRLRVLRLLHANPFITQRELAIQLGVSLGKANYSLKDLLCRGWVKVQSDHGKSNRFGIAYLLTPSGHREKALLTQECLKIKMAEYRSLRREIEVLRDESSRIGTGRKRQ